MLIKARDNLERPAKMIVKKLSDITTSQEDESGSSAVAFGHHSATSWPASI